MASDGDIYDGTGGLEVIKVCEFFAHVDTVICAHVGRRSGQLLATGSADRQVNIWKIGNPRAELNLRGHSDSVGCLKFTGNEETLLSGCLDGSIRIWDLNHNGALKGRMHLDNRAITAIDPHPYGDFFAIGTIDGRLEIWNAKQRKNIASYPGNNSSISILKHSPDGQNIIAGHSSGAVKVWDLTACKLRGELLPSERGQVNTVNAVAFHPQDRSFVIGSESGLVEVIEFVGNEIDTFSTTEIYEPVKRLVLNDSGDALLCASNSHLSVMSIDQPQTNFLCENSDVNLANLVDLCYHAHDSVMLAVSVDNTAVTIHSVRAPEELKFATNFFQHSVKELFMEPRRNVDKPQGSIRPRHAPVVSEDAMIAASRPENDLHTEHAIDDYITVDDILPVLLSDHDSIITALSERLTKTKQICSLWSHGYIKDALSELVAMKDDAITAQFLDATLRPLNNGVLTLQLCPLLLSVVDMLLTSQYQNHVKTALKCLDMVLLCYSDVISSTRKGPMLTSCDVAREERLSKCNECYRILSGPILQKIELAVEGSVDLDGVSTTLITRIRDL